MEKITDVQLDVLRWISRGCPDDLVDLSVQSAKSRARALANRKLVTIDNSYRGWTAQLTAAGDYYLEHGDYPPDHRLHDLDLTPIVSDQGTSAVALPRVTATQASPVSPEPPIERAPKTSLAPASVSEPVVRVLKANPHWLRIEKSFAPRALRVAQHLAQSARDLGWEVRLPDHPEKDWHGWAWSGSQSFESLTFHLPHASVPIIFKTFQDSRDGERRLRVLARTGYKPVKVEDTRLSFVEDKLDRLLDFAAAKSLSAQRSVHDAEVARAEAVEAARLRDAERLRAWNYGAWRDALLDHQRRWLEHRQTRTFVDVLAAEMIERCAPADRERVAAYVEWAQRYVEESDPLTSVSLPSSALPDMTYEEWRAQSGGGLGRGGRGGWQR